LITFEYRTHSAALHAEEQETSHVNPLLLSLSPPKRDERSRLLERGARFRGQNCECNLTFPFEAHPKKNIEAAGTAKVAT